MHKTKFTGNAKSNKKSGFKSVKLTQNGVKFCCRKREFGKTNKTNTRIDLPKALGNCSRNSRNFEEKPKRDNFTGATFFFRKKYSGVNRRTRLLV